METKTALLEWLEGHRGEAVSGQRVADALGVSRTAVWKAAAALRREGYEISAEGGYRLAGHSDRLSEGALRAYLGDAAAKIVVLDEADSTNLVAKRLAIEGAPHGTLVMAEGQTAGRGRLGRGFISPPGGLYMSVLLRPGPLPAEALTGVTAAAAVAVCQAVSALCGVELQIKWVNDCYLGEKKCCGILTEGTAGFETGGIESIVVGLGLNYTTPPEAFGPELAGVAASLFPGGAPAPRARLAAGIYTRLLALFAALPQRPYLAEYRRRSLLTGRRVTVLAAAPYEATVRGIDDEARLLVETAAGEIIPLAAGEVQLDWRRQEP